MARRKRTNKKRNGGDSIPSILRDRTTSGGIKFIKLVNWLQVRKMK